MKIVFLDFKTLSFQLDTSGLYQFGQVQLYDDVLDNEAAVYIKDADIIITNQNNLDERNLRYAEKLKLICAAATGFDNIDISYCRNNGIAVTNVPGYATNSVAQHTFAMLLYLISHSRYYDEFVKHASDASSPLICHENQDFFELEGKTWGIIGLGKIGKKVGQYARGFGCNVIYYTTSGRNQDNDFKAVTMADLLETSDIISIHSPLSGATRGLIGIDELRQMKKNSYLLNLGRGGILNERDLVYALENKIIAGAGLDVFENEPLPPDSPLRSYIDRYPAAGNLYLTPHIGYASIEARERLMQTISSNISSFLEGGSLNRVDIE